MTPTITSARVRELGAKATGGEWDIWRELISSHDGAIAELTAQVRETEPLAEALYLLNAGGKCPATTGCGPTSEANAALIAALCSEPARNRIATALDLLERVEAGDAGLVEKVAQQIWELGASNDVDMSDAHLFARAALAALVGEGK